MKVHVTPLCHCEGAFFATAVHPTAFEGEAISSPISSPSVIARSRAAATKQSHRLWRRLLTFSMLRDRQKPARSDIKVEETACFQHPVKRGLRAVLRDRQKPARSDIKEEEHA